MSDLKVTSTTTQTAAGPQEGTGDADLLPTELEVENWEAAQAPNDGMSDARSELDDLNKKIDVLETQLNDPNLPPPIKSQLTSMLNSLTQKRSDIYSDYPELAYLDTLDDAADDAVRIKVPQ